jgi:dolichol-phosphate mannosyltransferase
MSSEDRSELAVVMPVHDEAACIERVIREWWHEVERHTSCFRFIVIDDGSTDSTPLLLSALAADVGERLICIRQENRGHGQACMAGYRRAAGDRAMHVLQIDSDGQCDPRYFGSFWALRNSFPLVYGDRVRRDDGALRRFASATHRIGLAMLEGVYCADPNVPYRLMRTSVVAPYVARIPSNVVLANVVLAVLLARNGVPSATVPIRFRCRYGGAPSLRLGAMAVRGLRSFIQLREIS